MTEIKSVVDSREMLYIFFEYYRILYLANQNFIKLCGFDAYRESLIDNDVDKVLLVKILCEIPRLIPYRKKSEEKKVILSLNDGLMRFDGHPNLGVLKQNYENIIKHNEKILFDIKVLRDKYEHEPHLLKMIIASSSSKKELFSFTYKIGDSTCIFKCSEMIELLSGLNRMYDNIRTELVIANNSDGVYRFKVFAMYELSLMQFNRIYESKLLNDVGKAMWPIQV